MRKCGGVHRKRARGQGCKGGTRQPGLGWGRETLKSILFKSALKVSNIFKRELKTQKCKREKGDECLGMSIGGGGRWGGEHYPSFFFPRLFSEANAHIGKPEFPILCAEKHCIQEPEKSWVPQILWVSLPLSLGSRRLKEGIGQVIED